jgi:hypothetical protein
MPFAPTVWPLGNRGYAVRIWYDLVDRRSQVIALLTSEQRRRHSARSTAQADIETHLDWLKQRGKRHIVGGCPSALHTAKILANEG